MDRDQASNTLAWRWVARLHTKGRPYIARAPNISKFTNGRFFPTDQLVADVKPLCGTAEHLRMPMPNAVTPAQIDGDYVLQIKEEDMLRTCAAACACGNDWGFGDSWKITIAHRRGGARIFSRCYAIDVCGKKTTDKDAWADEIVAACDNHQVTIVVTGYAPVGPVATALSIGQPDLCTAGIYLQQVR